MSCGICDEPADEVEVENEDGCRISVPICNGCLLEPDMSLFFSYLDAQFDMLMNR